MVINYWFKVQEMYDKATDETIQEECPDIKWHFIGHLQSNKVGKVTSEFDLDLETVLNFLFQ